MNIYIHGRRGRMGTAIALHATKHGIWVMDDPARSDVIIDFSSPNGTLAAIGLAQHHKKPLVIGTTGHTTVELQAQQEQSKAIACVWSGNFSVGMNVLFAITRKTSAILGQIADVDIIEVHHAMKKDKPSGSAIRLAEAVIEGRFDFNTRHREAQQVPSLPSIPIHSVRTGGVIGDHKVTFGIYQERIELAHLATDRSIFADGALRAAQWVVGKEPGLYDMMDVLNLKNL